MSCIVWSRQIMSSSRRSAQLSALSPAAPFLRRNLSLSSSPACSCSSSFSSLASIHTRSCSPPVASSPLSSSSSSTTSSTLRYRSLQQPRRFFGGHAAEPPLERVPITFVTYEGNRFSVMAEVGGSLFDAALLNNVPIVAECGGGIPREQFGEGPNCRTCMVFLDQDHVAATYPVSEDETNIMYWIDGSNANSRLACQCIVTKEMKGATIVIPEVLNLKEIPV